MGYPFFWVFNVLSCLPCADLVPAWRIDVYNKDNAMCGSFIRDHCNPDMDVMSIFTLHPYLI